MRSRPALAAAFVVVLALAAVLQQKTRPGVPVEQPYSVQMHVHGSFSEGSGSIDSHTIESKRAGLDALWWSDHDWRIEAYRHCSRFSFDAFSERIDRLENWFANMNSEANATKGVKPAHAGSLDASSATIDPTRKVEGSASLLLSATSSRTTLQDLDYLLFAQRSRFLRSLASGVTLRLSLYPEQVGPDAHAYVEVQLSFHSDPALPPKTRHRIRYEFSPNGGTPSRSRELYRVPIAVAVGTWNTLALPITQDAAVGFAPFDGADNVLHDVFFGVEVQNGATARASFDGLQLTELVAPQDRFALEANLFLAKELEVPEVAQIQGTEISFIGEHLNEFSLAPELPDYEALFQASGLLNAQGQITNPTTMAHFVSRSAVAAVHARGGVISYNHIFGTNTSTTSSTPTKEQALAKLLANDLYGADILEVGYRQRGRSLAEHLWVWDQLGLSGRCVVGTGVSDSHAGYQGEYNGRGNTLVSWVWAHSVAAADLLAGLQHGRVFFGDIARFDGTLDLKTRSGFRMGDIVVTAAANEEVTLAVEGLVQGDTLRWIVSGTVVSSAVVGGTSVLEKRVIALDPATPTVVRVELYAAGGQEKVFSNPICFVRSAPLQALPRVVHERTRR